MFRVRNALLVARKRTGRKPPLAAIRHQIGYNGSDPGADIEDAPPRFWKAGIGSRAFADTAGPNAKTIEYFTSCVK